MANAPISACSTDLYNGILAVIRLLGRRGCRPDRIFRDPIDPRKVHVMVNLTCLFILNVGLKWKMNVFRTQKWETQIKVMHLSCWGCPTF